MENTEIFTMNEDRINICLKRLKSFKQSRVFSPILFLVMNFIFILDMVGLDSYFRTFIIYAALCLLTTIGIYFITSKAINRYNNIIVKFQMFNKDTFGAVTLTNNNFQIKRGQYHIKANSLTENKIKKLNTVIIVYHEEKFELIPDWFDNNQDLKNIHI